MKRLWSAPTMDVVLRTMGELSLSVRAVGGSQRSRKLVLTSGTVVDSQNTIPAFPRALFAAGLAEFDNEQSRDTIPREVDDCSSAGSESCLG